MLKFNNKDIPNFVKVKSVNIQTLAEVSTNLKNMVGGFGVLNGASTFGEKLISADISIIIPDGSNIQECGRILASWLKGDDFKLSPLTIMDDLGVYYMAKVSDSASISDLIVAGTGVLNFVIPSGVGISQEVKTHTGATRVVFDYEGSMKAFPIIEIDVKSDISNGSILVSNIVTGEKIILIGSFKATDKIHIDCSKHLVKVNNVLHMELIGLTTKFFGTVDGKNEFSCSISGSELKVIFQEKYL